MRNTYPVLLLVACTVHDPNAPVAGFEVTLHDQRVNVGDTAVMTAHGVPLGATQTWSLQSRPTASRSELQDPNAESARIYADWSGDYLVTLSVTDGETTTEVESMVTAILSPDAPVADAGDDYVGFIDIPLTLLSTSSDPNGLDLSFEWELVSSSSPDARLRDQHSNAASFTAPVAGDYVLQLTVHNGSLWSEPDMFVVTLLDEVPIEPGDVANGLFNPDEVYVFGVVDDGNCAPALVHWSDPSTISVGFDSCYVQQDKATIQPGGDLLYLSGMFLDDDRGLRVFTADDAPWNATDPYPVDTTANDAVLSTTQCDTSIIDPTIRFLVNPSGDFIYRCNSGNSWFFNGVPAPGLNDPWNEPLAWDDTNHVLTYKGVVNLSTGKTAGFSNLPSDQDAGIRTVRNAPQGGFWVVVLPYYQARPNPSLYHVEINGDATLVGEYPEAPFPYQEYYYFGGKYPDRIDGLGQLFHLAYDGDVSGIDVIRRSLLTGTSDVVFTGGDVTVGPYPNLVTGP
jgi:hypothetical protein